MIELTAVQKIRLALTGHPNREPEFQHEGPTITRWITTGPGPTAYVRFQHRGDQITALCPHCGEELGQFNANYGGNTCRELRKIRNNTKMNELPHSKQPMFKGT